MMAYLLHNTISRYLHMYTCTPAHWVVVYVIIKQFRPDRLLLLYDIIPRAFVML
jgi:hypothetical protein